MYFKAEDEPKNRAVREDSDHVVHSHWEHDSSTPRINEGDTVAVDRNISAPTMRALESELRGDGLVLEPSDGEAPGYDYFTVTTPSD